MRDFVKNFFTFALFWAFFATFFIVPITAYAQTIPAVDDAKLGLIALLVWGGRQLAELLAKAIPDSSEGVWGYVRKALKIAALYVPNK